MSTATTTTSTEATSTPDRPPLADRFADRMNPILVKEVRQAMKSRGFVGTLMLLIGACWLVSLVGSLNFGSALEYYAFGPWFFALYFIPLVTAIGIVVPFLTYNSMLNERLDDTFEMLSITTLNARRIVNGKLLTAISLIVLCYSAITPFIAFTSLLQGFRWTPALFVMVIGIFASTGLCSLALVVSTLASNRLMQGFFSLILIAVLVYCSSFALSLFEPGFWTIPSTWSTFMGLGSICMVLVGVVYLLREVTVAQITFESDNRATGVRVVCSMLMVAVWGTTWWYFQFFTLPSGSRTTSMFLVNGLALPTAFLIIVVGYFSCTERPAMSQRVRRRVLRMPGGLRYLAFPWLPGCSRGYVFVLMHLFLFAAILLLIADPFGTWDPLVIRRNFALAATAYAMLYSGIATLISRLLRARNPDCRSTLVRATFLTVVSFSAVLPHLIVATIEQVQQSVIGYTWLMFSSPWATMLEISNSGGLSEDLMITLQVLGISSLVLFVLNCRGIADSVIEMQSDQGPGSATQKGAKA